MNVLHLSPSFFPATYYGGPIRSSLALGSELVRLGCAVRVLTTNSNGPRVVPTPPGIRVKVHGIEVVYCRRLLQPDIAPALVAELPEHVRWADVVHITGVFSWTTLPGLAAANLFRKPVVWSPRGSLMTFGMNRRRAPKRAWLAACDAVRPARITLHVTSEEERAQADAIFPTIPKALIANGVEIPEPAPRPAPASVLHLLAVGRLHPAKGIENLLEACDLAPNTRLIIAGEGDPDYVSKLRRKAKALDGRVSFAGEVLGIAKNKLFAACDVFVSASHTENFGISIAEALAHGVPVIASRGTPWQRVQEKGCGLWVDNSPQSLAAAFERIRSMPLAEMGARGRAWMEAEYTWQPRAQSMLAVYRDLANASWQSQTPAPQESL